MADGGHTVPRIIKAEHIGEETGDNIEAKRVAPYQWAGPTDKWKRPISPLVNETHDSIDFSNPDGNGNYQTATYELDGSTVLVLNFTYDGNNNVTSIARI